MSKSCSMYTIYGRESVKEEQHMGIRGGLKHASTCKPKTITDILQFSNETQLDNTKRLGSALDLIRSSTLVERAA